MLRAARSEHNSQRWCLEESFCAPRAARPGDSQRWCLEESICAPLASWRGKVEYWDMEWVEMIRDTYIRMYDGMIAKEESLLRDVLDDSFVLVHMTGMRQSKEEFIRAVMDGTLNYYSAEHENMPVKIDGDNAVLTGQSLVSAAVFGGGRSRWHLQQKCSLKRVSGKWKITGSVASTY